MAEITYYSFDLVTLDQIGTLPFAGVSWTRQLNGAGQFGGKLNLADPDVQAKPWATATRESRTLLVVDVDGAIEWGGILWDRPYDSPTRTLSITANEAWSYFARRAQARDYTSPPATGPGHTYWSTTPAAAHNIAAALVADAIAVPASALATMTIERATDGTAAAITESYPLSQKQTVTSMVTQLAGLGLGTGFDFTIEWAWEGEQGSTPVPTLVLSFPRAGRTAGETGIVIDAGQAGAKGYTWSPAGSQQANQVHGMASGSGSLSTVVADPTVTGDGWPLLEKVVSFMAINDQSTLTAASKGELAAAEWPVVTPTVTLTMFDGSLVLGDFSLGDTGRLLIPPDERFATGVDDYLRITAWTCTPGDKGEELMTLTLQSAPGLAPVPPPPGV